jgi:hypothetical protein
MEEKIIFQPDARIHQTPGNVGLAFDDVYFATEDGVRLNGWFVPRRGATLTLLWFHGNAGNISHRVENIGLLNERVNVNIFIFRLSRLRPERRNGFRGRDLPRWRSGC